jgi:hypothetical protein
VRNNRTILRVRACYASAIATSFALLLAATAHAGNHTLWSDTYSIPTANADKVAASFYGASRQLTQSCSNQIDLRHAIGRVHVSGKLAGVLKLAAAHFNLLVRAAGYDDTCSASTKFLVAAGQIGAENLFCPGVGSVCTGNFSLTFEGIRHDRLFLPICSLNVRLNLTEIMSLHTGCKDSA